MKVRRGNKLATANPPDNASLRIAVKALLAGGRSVA